VRRAPKRFGSRGIWERLEELARERIQEFVQGLLEEEVTALVGRKKSERRPLVGEGSDGLPQRVRQAAAAVPPAPPMHPGTSRGGGRGWAGSLNRYRLMRQLPYHRGTSSPFEQAGTIAPSSRRFRPGRISLGGIRYTLLAAHLLISLPSLYRTASSFLSLAMTCSPDRIVQ